MHLPIVGVCVWQGSTSTWSAISVVLTEVPDYSWDAGCFGTATGNLMGYWDRHGFPNFYTGPTGGGVAPLNSDGANQGIRSLWASRAGLDGRPATQPGHMDDYWVTYESTAPDPYTVAGRAEHTPDCTGDFFGLNQNKWDDLNGECSGNIDGFSFVFWDAAGEKRFSDLSELGRTAPDIPSGLRAWTQFRGSQADTFSQLVDFHPNVPAGHGFTFEDLKAEIDAGYPVLLFLQEPAPLYRSLPGMDRANPNIHGMLAYGYRVDDEGVQRVRYRTSWASGDANLAQWTSADWEADLPVRGVISYHPRPKITHISQASGGFTVEWEGPSSILSNVIERTSAPVHHYVVERATVLDPPNFEPVTEPTTERVLSFPNCCPDEAAFFRLKLLAPSLQPWNP